METGEKELTELTMSLPGWSTDSQLSIEQMGFGEHSVSGGLALGKGFSY